MFHKKKSDAKKKIYRYKVYKGQSREPENMPFL